MEQMTDIRKAPPVADLTTATPKEIDERNARLDLEIGSAQQAILSVIDTAHRIAGDRYTYQGRGRGRKVWGMSDEDAERIMRERIAAGTVPLSYRHGADRELTRLDQARETLRANEAERDLLDAEFDRRGGWSRFFTVPGGHVHSGLRCEGGTIRATTLIGWTPHLSGKSEAEAIEFFRSMAHVMCSHCFPNAPVITPIGTVYCEGSRQPGKEGTWVYSFPNGTAVCTGCGQRQTVTPTRNIRAHKPPASDAAEPTES